MLQIKDFWPRYWGGVVLFDRGMEFFKALGGGKQFIERNFGDWAPPAEVIEICTQLQQVTILVGLSNSSQSLHQ